MKLFKRQILFAFTLLLCSCFSSWAYENFLAGSRFMALSQCGTAVPDIWSVSQNQAGLAYLKNTAVSLSNERRFMLKELSINSLAAVVPSRYGTFGAVVNYFGFSKYHEMKTGIAYSLQLGPKLSAGIMLDYFSTYTINSGKHNNRIAAEFGLMGKPIHNLTIGCHIFNPLPEKPIYGKENDLPSVLKLGLAHKIHSTITLIAETQLGTMQQPNYKFGLEYYPVNSFALRMGINTWPAKFSGGIAYSWKRFEISIACAQHQVLGSTTTFEMLYNIF